MTDSRWQVGDRIYKRLRFGSIEAHVSKVSGSSFVIHVVDTSDVRPQLRDYQSQAIAMQDGWVQATGDRV